jgi:hypothetical protein
MAPKTHNFGSLLDRLAVERGLTNRELAKLARVAPDTIRIQRTTRECRFRRLTAAQVLKELGSIKPLSSADLETFRELAGIEDDSHAGTSRAKLARLSGNTSATDAEELFSKLLEEFGPSTVADALRSLSNVMRGSRRADEKR